MSKQASIRRDNPQRTADIDTAFKRILIARGSEQISPSKTSKLVGSECGVDLACKLCSSEAKGVIFEAKGVFVHARLCSCVASCSLCSGSCAIPDLSTTKSIKACKEVTPIKKIAMINDAKIPARYIDACLEKFKNFSGTGKQVIGQVTRWADHFKAGKSSGLVLSGHVGVGKTFLMCAIAKHLALRGISVRFSDFFQLINELKESFHGDNRDPSLLRPLHEFDVLIIDELGKGRGSEWEVSVADTLISERYSSSRAIVASTNYSLKETKFEPVQASIDIWSNASASTNSNQMNTEQFEGLSKRLGPRIFSRLKEMAVFLELTGDDYRRA